MLLSSLPVAVAVYDRCIILGCMLQDEGREKRLKDLEDQLAKLQQQLIEARGATPASATPKNNTNTAAQKRAQKRAAPGTSPHAALSGMSCIWC